KGNKTYRESNLKVLNKEGKEVELNSPKRNSGDGKNLVKEIAIRKGTRIRSYIDGRTYTVDYEVVDTKHFSLRYGGGR
ncbi:MAG: hypothetical protein EBZ49_12920, partial [Proteobacteria bacterium]|nr:hypothetical protein [Pseudomonadota bacterium]